MRALLTTIGSQGDVRPLVALASRLREHGHEARLCVSPDFGDWIESLGFPFTPIGPQVRGTLGASAPKANEAAQPLAQPPERLRELAKASVGKQFATIAKAAWGCDVILTAAGRPPAPARTVAETLGIRYVFAVFSPSHLPSPHHAPFGLSAADEDQSPSSAGNLELWAKHAGQLNDRLRPALNTHRAARAGPGR
jgi:vancomycin aglycone glucosyltransferase